MIGGIRIARASALRRAALAGGACQRRRGCARIALIAGLTLASVAAAQPVVMDSGLNVVFHEMINEGAGYGLAYRFRFIVPDIAGDVDFEQITADMDWLCNNFALPRIADTGPQPSRIVVSLMAEPVKFGEANPDIVQFFEAYSIGDGVCIWEPF